MECFKSGPPLHANKCWLLPMHANISVHILAFKLNVLKHNLLGQCTHVHTKPISRDDGLRVGTWWGSSGPFQSKGSLPKTNASFGGSAFRVLQIVKRFCESNTGLVHSYNDGIVRVSMIFHGISWIPSWHMMAYAVFTAHGLTLVAPPGTQHFVQGFLGQVQGPDLPPFTAQCLRQDGKTNQHGKGIERL